MRKNKQTINLNDKTIWVTGSPGFIGAYLVMRLLSDRSLMRGGTVVSIDNMNDYYDLRLKEYRLSLLEAKSKNSPVSSVFRCGNIADKSFVQNVFSEYRPDIIIHLAAQAGVRYSITNPDAYIESNIIGFFNILELCRHACDDGKKGVEHFIFASSSSVYGESKIIPFSTDDKVDHPVSLYAATKKSDELMAYSYAKLYDIPTTGLRFFTVYGPAGRPDMFYFSATQRLVNGESIKVYNYGDMERDFTYIDDIIEGIVRVVQGCPKKELGEDGLPIAPYALYNIGGGSPENLLSFINTLQEELVNANVLPEDYDFESHRELVGMQPGDVPITYADTKGLETDYNFRPTIGIRDGLRHFCEWYKEYYIDNGSER